MRVSRRALRQFQKGEQGSTEVPINLVPMIDILTVLVLYLLVGAIATHMSILQLALPSKDAAPPPPDKESRQLVVIVRETALDIADERGPIAHIPQIAKNIPNYTALTAKLLEIKQKLPKEESIVLLLEPDIEYDMLVQVMDSVRMRPKNSEDPLGGLALFPNISIGDAPETPAPTKTAVAPKA
jgi:biopolymer transport protein ExbD